MAPPTVQYATANGSATAGTHYSSTSGTLSFADGETQKTINVQISGNGSIEGDRTFTITLSAPGLGAELGADTASVNNVITPDAPNANSVEIKFKTSTGEMSGKLIPTGATLKHKFSGVVLQHQAEAYGFFLGRPGAGTPIESGGVFYEVD